MLILGQVCLNEGQLFPEEVGKKNTSQVYFNNPRSSILPGSAPDPISMFSNEAKYSENNADNTEAKKIFHTRNALHPSR